MTTLHSSFSSRHGGGSALRGPGTALPRNGSASSRAPSFGNNSYSALRGGFISVMRVHSESEITTNSIFRQGSSASNVGGGGSGGGGGAPTTASGTVTGAGPGSSHRTTFAPTDGEAAGHRPVGAPLPRIFVTTRQLLWGNDCLPDANPGEPPGENALRARTIGGGGGAAALDGGGSQSSSGEEEEDDGGGDESAQTVRGAAGGGSGGGSPRSARRRRRRGPVCSHCGLPGGPAATRPLLLCSCLAERYCSEACQRARWPLHQRLSDFHAPKLRGAGIACDTAGPRGASGGVEYRTRHGEFMLVRTAGGALVDVVPALAARAAADAGADAPLHGYCCYCWQGCASPKRCVCGEAIYCSVACQAADWPRVHQYECALNPDSGVTLVGAQNPSTIVARLAEERERQLEARGLDADGNRYRSSPRWGGLCCGAGASDSEEEPDPQVATAGGDDEFEAFATPESAARERRLRERERRLRRKQEKRRRRRRRSYTARGRKREALRREELKRLRRLRRQTLSGAAAAATVEGADGNAHTGITRNPLKAKHEVGTQTTPAAAAASALMVGGSVWVNIDAVAEEMSATPSASVGAGSAFDSASASAQQQQQLMECVASGVPPPSPAANRRHSNFGNSVAASSFVSALGGPGNGGGIGGSGLPGASGGGGGGGGAGGGPGGGGALPLVGAPVRPLNVWAAPASLLTSTVHISGSRRGNSATSHRAERDRDRERMERGAAANNNNNNNNNNSGNNNNNSTTHGGSASPAAGASLFRESVLPSVTGSPVARSLHPRFHDAYSSLIASVANGAGGGGGDTVSDAPQGAYASAAASASRFFNPNSLDGAPTRTGGGGGGGPIAVVSFSGLLRQQSVAYRALVAEEAQQWSRLLTGFHETRTTLELQLLEKEEEMRRSELLVEEVLWCLKVGFPQHKAIKEKLFDFYYRGR